jgi:signal transduction histidine kinase
MLFIAILGIIIWIFLLLVQVLTQYDTSVICQNLEFCIDLVNIILALMIYYKMNLEEKKLFKFFTLSIVFLFILDVLYYIVYSIPHKSSYAFIFDIFHFIYYAITITFIVRALFLYVLEPRNIFVGLIVAFIVNIGVFLIFSIDTKSIHEYWSLRNTIQIDFIGIIQSVVDLILFNLAFFWLIYSKKIGVAIIASAYIVLTASEFMMTSCYVSGIKTLLPWAELFWMLGLILLIFGMTKLISTKSYDIKAWFASSTDIRIKFSFYSFVMIVFSLILFFILLKQVATINEKFYIFFPTIIMIGSLIIAFISIFIGKTVEQPLLNIQNDINHVLLNDKSVTDFKIIDSKHYSETQRIAQQIKTLISLVNKQSKDAAIGLLAREIAHDIQSPLSTLQYCKDKLSNIVEIDEKLLKSLKTSIDSIKYILINLLNLNIKQTKRSYEKQDTVSTLLHDLVDSIVVQKSIEYHAKCEFNFNDNTTCKVLWLFINPEEFKHKLSNLISNACEATEANAGVKCINFIISNDNDYAYLTITDNGCGISKEALEKIKHGYSSKSAGNGIGLKSAIKFFEENNGKLFIESAINEYTKVNVQIKTSSTPSWFPTTITLRDFVVVLDDDPSIHYFIQSNISRALEVKYFTQISQFKEWINNNESILNRTTFFIDYYIEDGHETGLELINYYKINMNAYLLTNEFSVNSVQENATKSQIRIIPKILLTHIAETNQLST